MCPMTGAFNSEIQHSPLLHHWQDGDIHRHIHTQSGGSKSVPDTNSRPQTDSTITSVQDSHCLGRQGFRRQPLIITLAGHTSFVMSFSEMPHDSRQHFLEEKCYSLPAPPSHTGSSLSHLLSGVDCLKKTHVITAQIPRCVPYKQVLISSGPLQNHSQHVCMLP